jgi:phosphocarrier protein HPr
VQVEITVVNKLGVHARPSAAITQVASRFKSDVWLTKNTRRVNAKSIMGVMMLAAAKGAKLQLEITGVDEQEAATALTELFASGFGEEI